MPDQVAAVPDSPARVGGAVEEEVLLRQSWPDFSDLDADELGAASEPSWVGTARYGIRPAPAGLALVQDFLNTCGSAQGGPDLLCDGTQASDWARGALQAWSAQRGAGGAMSVLTDHDALVLRDLREVLGNVLAGSPVASGSPWEGTVTLSLNGAGEICWSATGEGGNCWYGAILGEVLLSRHVGTWVRLKRCRNQACAATFYDSTWNCAAVWHNPGTCARMAADAAG